MLAIRMQRTGRHGHAMFRIVVQNSRFTPTSGNVVATLGSYDPHTKAVTLSKDKVKFYLDHGAQPSPQAVRLLKSEDIKMPSWVKPATKKTANTKTPEKLRKNRLAETKEEKVSEPEPEVKAESETASEKEEVVEEKTDSENDQEEGGTTEQAPKSVEAEPDKPAENAADTPEPDKEA